MKINSWSPEKDCTCYPLNDSKTIPSAPKCLPYKFPKPFIGHVTRYMTGYKLQIRFSGHVISFTGLILAKINDIGYKNLRITFPVM